MDQGSVIPIAQLVYPVRASYQDQGDCRCQKYHEHLEGRRQWFLPLLDPLRSPLCSYIADCELYAQSYENAERKDLEGKTCEGDVDCDSTTS